MSRSRGGAYTAASRHFDTYRVAVARGESVSSEREDLRIFQGDVAAVQLCKLDEQG